MIGQTLAHYKILEKIGSGGMGDVYLAEDTKLGRKVALKVLPPHLAENEERRARFQREAKALAALDHANIVQVFSVEEAEGSHFITMQLVQGKTLTELIPTNGFVLNKFFAVAIPLADAVAAAHQEGITHRDLKPDNVMVSDDGRVTVLDFGLAKPTPGLATEGSELETQAKTAEGTIVGTLHYMSPEQTQGKTVDARSDIFSLGIMFYEMLTGRRPFTGETPAEVLSSINKDAPPPVADLRPQIPRALSRIVQRCLVKDPTRRAQSALDVRNELEELKAELGSGELLEGAPLVGSSVNKWLAAAAVASLLALAGVLVHYWRAPESSGPHLRLLNARQVTSAAGVETHPTWSPDGGRIAYEANQGGSARGGSGNFDIWVSQLGGGEPVNLTDDHKDHDRFPSWSPDGRQMAFFSRRDESWGLYIMSALGSSPRKVVTVEFAGSSPQWSLDGGEIAFFAKDTGKNLVEIVSLVTQETRRIPLPDHAGRSCLDLSWSPDGSTFAYVEGLHHAVEVTRLWIVSSSGGDPFPLTDGITEVWNPTWSANGRELFYVSSSGGSMELWQQRVGPDGKPVGVPESVTAGLGIRTAVFSADGSKLAYSRGRSVQNIWRVPLFSGRPATWADAEQITAGNAFAEHFDLSPGGERLVTSSDRGGNMDLWILPSEGGTMTQLTTNPAPDWVPRWSPDGNEIAFYSHRSGNRDIWVIPAEGGPARQLTTHSGPDAFPYWSPDGKDIVFDYNDDLWLVNAKGGEPRQLTTHPADDHTGLWSPDGQWLVFLSNRTGGRRLWRVSVEGGEPELLTETFARNPTRLSPDGEVVYFRRGESSAIWALSLEDGTEYPVTDLQGRAGSLAWGLATDGRYLYFNWSIDLGDIWVMDVVTEKEE